MCESWIVELVATRLTRDRAVVRSRREGAVGGTSSRGILEAGSEHETHSWSAQRRTRDLELPAYGGVGRRVDSLGRRSRVSSAGLRWLDSTRGAWREELATAGTYGVSSTSSDRLSRETFRLCWYGGVGMRYGFG